MGLARTTAAAPNPRGGLDHGRELAVEEAFGSRQSLLAQRHGHGGPLREVLEPYAEGQRHGTADRSSRDTRRRRAEGHPNRQALGDVVERYRRDEQHAAPPARVYPLRVFHLMLRVQVREH